MGVCCLAVQRPGEVPKVGLQDLCTVVRFKVFDLPGQGLRLMALRRRCAHGSPSFTPPSIPTPHGKIALGVQLDEAFAIQCLSELAAPGGHIGSSCCMRSRFARLPRRLVAQHVLSLHRDQSFAPLGPLGARRLDHELCWCSFFHLAAPFCLLASVKAEKPADRFAQNSRRAVPQQSLATAL